MARLNLGRTPLTTGQTVTVISPSGGNVWSIVTVWTDSSGVSIGHDNSSAVNGPNIPVDVPFSLILSPDSAIIATGGTGANVNYAIQPLPENFAEQMVRDMTTATPTTGIGTRTGGPVPIATATTQPTIIVQPATTIQPAKVTAQSATAQSTKIQPKVTVQPTAKIYGPAMTPKGKIYSIAPAITAKPPIMSVTRLSRMGAKK